MLGAVICWSEHPEQQILVIAALGPVAARKQSMALSHSDSAAAITLLSSNIPDNIFPCEDESRQKRTPATVMNCSKQRLMAVDLLDVGQCHSICCRQFDCATNLQGKMSLL